MKHLIIVLFIVAMFCLFLTIGKLTEKTSNDFQYSKESLYFEPIIHATTPKLLPPNTLEVRDSKIGITKYKHTRE